MPDPLSDAQLAAYQAVADAASLEPWRAIEAADADVTQIWSDGDCGRLLARVAVAADGEFIVASRNAVPALLAEVERLRSDIARHEAAADAVMAMDGDVNTLFTLGQFARTYTHALIAKES